MTDIRMLVLGVSRQAKSGIEKPSHISTSSPVERRSVPGLNVLVVLR